MWASLIIGWILNRAREPSTWAGTGAIIAGAAQGGVLPSDIPSAIQALGVALCGLVAVVLKEKAKLV